MLAVVAVIGMWAGVQFARTGESSKGPRSGLRHGRDTGQEVEDILRFLETKYVSEVSSDEVTRRAIDAILSGLDPHSHYFPPDQMDELEERTTGHYVGIGIEIAFFRDSLVVLYPKKDSPAAKAGLRPGDYILAVGDVSIPQDTLDHQEIINLIKGEKGTKVKLTIKPMMSSTLRQVEVTRDEIIVPSVPAAYMLDSVTAYIKIDRFINATYKDFMDAWEQLSTKDHAKDLVLDLRDNPGGYLKEAVNLLSQMFPEEGKLLVYTEGQHQKRMDYKSTGKVFFPVDHIVILINEGSASASEIVAGCIQDQDRGWVIGSRSFGKGLVQEQFPLSNGGVLRLTVSRYYTPSGRMIQRAYDSLSVVDTVRVFKTADGRSMHAGGGIIPDIEVRDPVDWKNPVTAKWMDIISEFAIRYTLQSFGGKLVSVDSIPMIRSILPGQQEIESELMSLASLRSTSTQHDSLMTAWKKDNPLWLRIARSTLIAYCTGEAGWYRAYNEEDPVVQKAKEVIRKDR